MSVGAVIASGADGDSLAQTYTLYPCDWGGAMGNGRAVRRAGDEMEAGPTLREGESSLIHAMRGMLDRTEFVKLLHPPSGPSITKVESPVSTQRLLRAVDDVVLPAARPYGKFDRQMRYSARRQSVYDCRYGR